MIERDQFDCGICKVKISASAHEPPSLRTHSLAFVQSVGVQLAAVNSMLFVFQELSSHGCHGATENVMMLRIHSGSVFERRAVNDWIERVNLLPVLVDIYWYLVASLAAQGHVYEIPGHQESKRRIRLSTAQHGADHPVGGEGCWRGDQSLR